MVNGDLTCSKCEELIFSKVEEFRLREMLIKFKAGLRFYPNKYSTVILFDSLKSKEILAC